MNLPRMALAFYAVAFSLLVGGLAYMNRDSKEAEPIQYSTVAGYAEGYRGLEEARDLARLALSDGLLTHDEYDEVIDAVRNKHDYTYKADKARAIQKWSK